jgi:hypothetical protein
LTSGSLYLSSCCSIHRRPLMHRHAARTIRYTLVWYCCYSLQRG